MTPSNNSKQVQAFIGAINYYRDMWARQSNILHPLTALTSPKVKFKSTGVEQRVFDEIKHTVAHDTLLEYPHGRQKPPVRSGDKPGGEIRRFLQP